MISRDLSIGRALRARQRGFLLNPFRFGAGGGGGGSTDPNFANVSLLLHMDGVNGSTTFTDSSGSPKTVTAYGDAKISTAQSKFGGASGLFDGSGDYLTAPSSTAFGFGSGDFTIEGWLQQGSVTGDRCLVDLRSGGATGIALYSSVSATPNRLCLASNTAVIATASVTFSAATNFQHWAIARQSGVVRGFVDGALAFTVTDSRTFSSSASLAIGQSTSGQNFIGGLDELRVTKGVARYTAAFTPPTAAFPNS